jgi:hypothetical protein
MVGIVLITKNLYFQEKISKISILCVAWNHNNFIVLFIVVILLALARPGSEAKPACRQAGISGKILRPSASE